MTAVSIPLPLFSSRCSNLLHPSLQVLSGISQPQLRIPVGLFPVEICDEWARCYSRAVGTCNFALQEHCVIQKTNINSCFCLSSCGNCQDLFTLYSYIELFSAERFTDFLIFGYILFLNSLPATRLHHVRRNLSFAAAANIIDKIQNKLEITWCMTVCTSHFPKTEFSKKKISRDYVIF